MAEISVSIIVPVYNVEPYVEDCIRSVMRQTYEGHIECIVVNDCGTDKSMAIVKKLLADYRGSVKFKVLHHEYNRGLSAARNTGISHASGDYLMFVDSDDIIHDDYCKAACNCAERFHADLVMFSHLRIKKDREEEKGFTHEYRYSSDGYKTQRELMDIMFEDEGTATWNKLYQKSLFEKVSFPDGFLYEDEGTIYKLIMKASCIYYLDTILYYHYCRPGSITTQRNPKVFNDRAKLNLQRYLDLKEWGYHSEVLECKMKEFAFRYLITKRKDESNPDYVLFSKILRDTKSIPSSFSSKQVFYVYLFKYCPRLFDFYFAMREVKK